MKAEVLNDIVPLRGTAGFGTVLRSIHTEFLDHWSANREEARRERQRLKAEIVSTAQAGRPHATLLTAGQTAGGITDIPAVAELMRRRVAEAMPRSCALLVWSLWHARAHLTRVDCGEVPVRCGRSARSEAENMTPQRQRRCRSSHQSVSTWGGRVLRRSPLLPCAGDHGR